MYRRSIFQAGLIVNRLVTLSLIALCLLTACEQSSERSAASQPETASSMQPATPRAAELTVSAPALFAGLLPCADCEGIRYELDLHAPDAFFLRMTYLGKPAQNVFDDVGEWTVAADGKTLVLRGGREPPLMFSIEDAGSLRKLDAQGQPIAAELNHTLTREAHYAPIEPKARMRGMYLPQGGLEECSTGLKLALADEAAVADLRARYMKAKPKMDAAALVDFDGQIVQRAHDGGGTADTLIVERVHGLWPSESCGARGVTHDLAGTRWVLVRLGDTPVMVDENQREQFIALQSSDQRAVGNAGCNRLNASYQLDGDKLSFQQMATTRMACPDMKREIALIGALEAARTWRIEGAYLELFDGSGALLARFESRNL
jgi:copper homeostasis protein (lipoprotein)